MKAILLVISREAYTGLDTILGAFENSVQGEKDAYALALTVQGMDTGKVLRQQVGGAFEPVEVFSL